MLSLKDFFLKLIQGIVIGIGAVLPGISGGVLSVVFGVYQPIMEFLADPVSCLKTHLPVLFPVFLGYGIGFLGVANLLAFLLEKHSAFSICFFLGLIFGTVPSLFHQAREQGDEKGSTCAFFLCMLVVFALLCLLKTMSVQIPQGTPSFFFCGFCLALSIIAPGMSSSALLMPLGLYTPFLYGIGHLSPAVLIPAGISAVFTIILLSKAINCLFYHHYSLTFHGIIGILLASAVMTIPFGSFFSSARQCLGNLLCLFLGIAASCLCGILTPAPT